MMKVTIPTDHPIFENAKVGDQLTLTAKVTEVGEDGATAEVDKCELAEPVKVREPKKKLTPVEYLILQRKKAA